MKTIFSDALKDEYKMLKDTIDKVDEKFVNNEKLEISFLKQNERFSNLEKNQQLIINWINKQEQNQKSYHQNPPSQNNQSANQ